MEIQKDSLRPIVLIRGLLREQIEAFYQQRAL